MNLHLYIPAASSHAPGVLKGLIYGQLKRFRLQHTEDEVFELVNKRVNGLNLLRKTLGDKTIDYQEMGGYELFNKTERYLMQSFW